MDNITNRKIKILEVLNQSMISTDNYTSSNQPFFKKDNSELFTQYNNLKLEIPENVNNNVKLIY